MEKVIVSSELGVERAPGRTGVLAPEQSDRFIDYMFDKTALIQQADNLRIKSDTVELNRIGIGQSLIRKAVEAVDTGENQGVTFSYISLTTTKIRLDWELSSETLEDGIEGDEFDDHVARLMATQFGNDLEDLAINGDTTSSNPALSIFDGWRKQAVVGNSDGAAHIISHGGAGLNRAAANKALKTMPRQYLQRRGELKFFVGSNLIQDYLYSLTTSDAAVDTGFGANIIANGPVRTEGPAGFTTGYLFGVRAQEIPYFKEDRNGTYSGATGASHGDLWLTFPKNLLWAVKREVQVFREFKPKKDAVEYTVYTRVGCGIENVDAFVIITDVKAAQ